MNDRPDPVDGCPDPETLAAYVDGLLDTATRDHVEVHAADCSDCREILADAAAFRLDAQGAGSASKEAAQREVAPEPRVLRFRPRWRAGIVGLLAVAAAVLIVARLEPRWLPWSVGTGVPEVAELVAALGTQPTRPVEGRLSGGFTYRPPPTVTRGAPGQEISPDVQIAAARVGLAASGRTAAEQAARALAALATGEIDRGITALEDAVRQAPRDARHLNDLSAAYLARGARANRADDWRLALQTADRALAVDPSMPEALFNRALALDGLRSAGEARAAWQAYLKVDRTSPWGVEAAARCGC